VIIIFRDTVGPKYLFIQFTEKALKATMLAQEEARRLCHNLVGTEHFLLGLIREDQGLFGLIRKPGLAAEALKSAGVDLRMARTHVEKLVGDGSGAESADVEARLSKEDLDRIDLLEFTSNSKQLLSKAESCSQQRGQKSIGTAHLLIGLLSLDDCNGIKVLKNLSVNCEDLRNATVNLLDTRTDSN
jgi:ATP-dependent Clp protease ATP-binding subunit ClpC